MAHLSFYGAANQVTGSMYLFESDEGYKILVDCGLSYEEGEALEVNLRFPFDPEEIDLVVLTHAHIDHSGNLPTLINLGYEGQILCTEPTAALADILLVDSASIQGMKQKKGNRGRKRSSPQEPRLFGHKQVMDTVERMVTIPFNKPFVIHEGLSIELKPAGHILGAASVIIRFREGREERAIGFTGDLGKPSSKIVVDAETMDRLNYLVMECTYGGRYHQAELSGDEVLEKYIKETCIDQPGRLFIPAFSVGRTQAILFTIHKLFEDGRIPRGIRVFADSKLGQFSTGIHNRFRTMLNGETRVFLDRHEDLFRFPELYFIEDEADKKILEAHYEPCIVVSSAGMLEGGRIREHVANNIQNPACTFLIAGYCADGTLGSRLLKGSSRVSVLGKERVVYARIASTDAFSAHPDHDGLLEYLDKTLKISNLNKIFLTHGEPKSILAIGEELEKRKIDFEIPVRGDSYHLD